MLDLRANLAALILLGTSILTADAQSRKVDGRVLTSDSLPRIQVTVHRDFDYVGKFDFVLKGIAKGERYVFVDADQTKKIRRLFIAQFEGFLPDQPHTYNYNFDDAALMAGQKFRQNTYAFSNSVAERESPDAEAALTVKFLRARGFEIEDELMMSRFLTVPDAERKNELILFYLENASSSGKKIADFYSGDTETEVWQKISVGLTSRSRKAFKVSALP